MQEAIQLAVAHHPGTDEELLSTTINVWYTDAIERPPEILLPLMPLDANGLSEVLSERAGRLVKLRVPKRGTGRRWIKLAQDNARADFNRRVSGDEQRLTALRRLRDIAHLTQLPSRIECFDNSNIQGSDPVAAMAVYRHGKPDRSQYRRYRVKTVVGADDFATMAEILERRLRRGVLENQLPDLIIVDGGKGQLSAARRVLQLLGIRDQTQPTGDGPLIDIIGVVKPRVEHARGNHSATDRLVLPEIKNPIILKTTDDALRLVQSIRDEAHQTAVRYHRKRRRKVRLGSQIDELPGVGPTRRRALLRHFGSVEKIRTASIDEVARVKGIGPRLARDIHTALQFGKEQNE